MDEPLVLARGLEKHFGGFAAVAGVDFEVQKGEAFGFLGANGAGKSSTMRMIGATSARSGGELRVLGRDPDREGPAIRARLGVVPQEDNLDLELSVADNLFVYGRYFGIRRPVLRRRIAELLEFARLSERGGDKVDNLSGGHEAPPAPSPGRSSTSLSSYSWTSPRQGSTLRPATCSGTASTASSSRV